MRWIPPDGVMGLHSRRLFGMVEVSFSNRMEKTGNNGSERGRVLETGVNRIRQCRKPGLKMKGSRHIWARESGTSG